MNAGQLRNYVAVQSRVDTVDDIGQPSTSWLTVTSVWANIKYLNGLSAIKSGADVSLAKVSIRVRHGSFNAGQRILYGNEAFNIEAVLPDGKKTYIDLVCSVTNADV